MIDAIDEPLPRYTAHQVARCARADATTSKADYLFKAAGVLHATYQVRLLAFMAASKGRQLIIQVPKHCRRGESLTRLMKAHADLIRFESV